MDARHSKESTRSVQSEIELETYRFLLEKGTGVIFDSRGLWVNKCGMGLVFGLSEDLIAGICNTEGVRKHARKGFFHYLEASEALNHDEEESQW